MKEQNPKTGAAFFDIDGTLLRNSALISHFKKLVRYEIIEEIDWLREIRPIYELYDKRVGEYDDYLDRVTEVYKRNLKGLPKPVVDFTAAQVVEKYGDVVYRYTRERIEWHKKRGEPIFFISGSPDFLVEKLAKKYGATEFRATRYHVDENDCFTAELDPMWDSVHKERVLKELLNKYHLDPKKCYAYGDTNGDYSMLKTLGHPKAMNPSRKLLELLRKDEELRNRCEIIVERKDVIYFLDGSGIREGGYYTSSDDNESYE